MHDKTTPSNTGNIRPHTSAMIHITHAEMAVCLRVVTRCPWRCYEVKRGCHSAVRHASSCPVIYIITYCIAPLQLLSRSLLIAQHTRSLCTCVQHTCTVNNSHSFVRLGCDRNILPVPLSDSEGIFTPVLCDLGLSTPP